MFIEEEITFCLELERSLDWEAGLRKERRKKYIKHTEDIDQNKYCKKIIRILLL